MSTNNPSAKSEKSINRLEGVTRLSICTKKLDALIKSTDPDWKQHAPAVLEGNKQYYSYLLNNLVCDITLFRENDYCERLLVLASVMGFPEGQLIQMMLDVSLREIHSNQPEGWNCVEWLFDQQYLATRADLGKDGSHNAIATLNYLWNENRGYYIHPDEDHTISWIRKFFDKIIQGGGTITSDAQGMDVLLLAARNQEQGENAGLMMALLDAGALYDACLADEEVRESAKDRVKDHPRWRRENLEMVVVDTERYTPHKQKF